VEGLVNGILIDLAVHFHQVVEHICLEEPFDDCQDEESKGAQGIAMLGS
jgi:hypothetical protein